MRRISSGTFLLKRIFPVVVFGFLLVFAVGPFVAPLIGGTVTGSPFVFVAFTLAMGIAFYFQTKKMIFDLADEVLDDGDWLVSVLNLLESLESVVFQGRRSDSKGDRSCGRMRTDRNTIVIT